MKKIGLLFIALTCVLSSCVYSLFPIYTVETLVYDDNLEGSWQQGDAVITFSTTEIDEGIKINLHDGTTTNSKPDPTSKARYGYRMKIVENTDSVVYQVHLVNIGEEYYLDLFPSVGEDLNGLNGLDLISRNLYPVHTFSKINIEENKILITSFNLSKLNKLFKKNLIRLRHEVVGDDLDSDTGNGDIIITAKPIELQKFIKTYSKDPSVFDQPEEYTRV